MALSEKIRELCRQVSAEENAEKLKELILQLSSELQAEDEPAREETAERKAG